MSSETLENLLDLFESLFRAQLNTIKQLKKGIGVAVPEKSTEKRMSQMDIVYDILKQAGQPMHINHILAAAKQRFDIVLDRESVVSALAKRVKRNDRFIKTGPNTFTLIDQQPPGGRP